MKITTLVLILFIAIMIFFLVMRYFRLKRDAKDSVGLADAYRSGDFDTYLAIINKQIESAPSAKDKNILATLKIQAYLQKHDWAKMDALKKQVDMKKLPKDIRLTFLCHYITGLFLSERSDAAASFLKSNQNFLKEGEGNSRYQLYLDGFRAFSSFYQGNFDKAKTQFEALKKAPGSNDFYRKVYDDYLHRIADETNHGLSSES